METEEETKSKGTTLKSGLTTKIIQEALKKQLCLIMEFSSMIVKEKSIE